MAEGQAAASQGAEGNAVTDWYTNVRQAPEWRYIVIDLILKAAAPLYYFFCTALVTDNYVINFVVTTTLIVVEFWFTKNITGRRLTGMRWWQVPSQDDNSSTWRFEHRSLLYPEYKPSAAAGTQFWFGMLGLLAYWMFMGVVSLSNPTYLILCIMAIFFVFANLLGFWRCRGWAQKLRKAVSNSTGGVFSGLSQGVAGNIMQNVVGSV